MEAATTTVDPALPTTDESGVSHTGEEEVCARCGKNKGEVLMPDVRLFCRGCARLAA